MIYCVPASDENILAQVYLSQTRIQLLIEIPADNQAKSAWYGAYE
jgi:hypothetical protein